MTTNATDYTALDNRAWFIETVTAASEAGTLVYVQPRLSPEHIRKRVKLQVHNYGGARMDRIHDRNKITREFGFPDTRGSKFWSADEIDGSGGTFLANILAFYGRESTGWFEIDGVPIPLHSTIEVEGRGYMSLDPVHWDGPPTGESAQ